MKKSLIYFMTLLFAGLFVMSCDDDGDDPVVIDNPIYGMQITGTATADEVLVIEAKQVVEPSSDYATKTVRDGMYYEIHYLSAGSFTFSEVTADETITYGASVDSVATQTAEAGEAFSYSVGKLVSGGTDAFTVAEAGLYYIMTDETSSKFWVMKIENFEISATGDKIAYTSGSATTAAFEAASIDIRAKFKLRINTAWKFICEDIPYGTDFPDDHIRPVISYGGSLTSLSAEGDDIEVDNNGQLLNFALTWTSGAKGIAGFAGTTEEAGELPPAEFPENMYMIGASIGGWDWAANGIEMIPVNSNAHLFWKVVWIEAGVADAGIKFCEEKDWGKDFGIDGDATDGVYAKGTSNVPDVAESGYYMVVVNLEDETVEVNVPTVKGIGPAFGDADWAGVDFTVNNANEVVESPAVSADENLRMYVTASTLTNDEGNAIEWWQAEFNVYSGVIEYRGAGGDQAEVAVTTGQVVKLKFKDDTAVIE